MVVPMSSSETIPMIQQAKPLPQVQAVDVLRASGEPHDQAHALDLLSMYAMSAGCFDEAITLVLEALA